MNSFSFPLRDLKRRAARTVLVALAFTKRSLFLRRCKGKFSSAKLSVEGEQIFELLFAIRGKSIHNLEM